jgi:hypothetical protein
MPVNNRMHTHKLGPARVCGIEVCQELAMRIGSPRPQEYRLDGWLILRVCLEGRPHGQRIAFEVEVVFYCRLFHEILNFGERTGRYNVYCLEGPSGGSDGRRGGTFGNRGYRGVGCGGIGGRR